MGVFKIIRNTNDGLVYMENALNYVLNGTAKYGMTFSYNTDITIVPPINY